MQTDRRRRTELDGVGGMVLAPATGVGPTWRIVPNGEEGTLATGTELRTEGAARCWLRRRTATHRGRPPYRIA
ncbi:hypothetical protein Hanom_Chr09g00867391 [Helianthus anomalus]